MTVWGAGSFDHLVGADQDDRRKRQAETPGRFQIDDQLERGRLLNGQIAWSLSFQDSVDIAGGALEQDGKICPIDDEPAGFRIFSERIDGRNFVPSHRVDDLPAFAQQDEVGCKEGRIRSRLDQPAKGVPHFSTALYFKSL